MDLISSFTNNVVTKALDGRSARHTAISSNLANVDTPNYAKQSVSFEGQLQQAIEGHRQPHASQQRVATNDEAPATAGGAYCTFPRSGASWCAKPALRFGP